MQPNSAVAPPVASAPVPFTVGGVVGRTFSTWSKNLVPFAVLSFFTQAPNFAYGIWTQYATFGGYPSLQQRLAVLGGPAGTRAGILPPGYWAVTAVVVVVMMVLSLVQMGALTYGAIQHLAGRRVTLGALVGVALRRAWPVFAAGFIASVYIGLATILLVVPGIIVACASMACVPAVMAENLGPMAAVKRSFALTKGRRFRIFVSFLVMAIVAWIAAGIGGVLPLALGGGTASLIGACVGFVVTCFATPLVTLLPAVAYHDLRVEKEGVDTAELAKVFE